MTRAIVSERPCTGQFYKTQLLLRLDEQMGCYQIVNKVIVQTLSCSTGLNVPRMKTNINSNSAQCCILNFVYKRYLLAICSLSSRQYCWLEHWFNMTLIPSSNLGSDKVVSLVNIVGDFRNFSGFSRS